jgi:hypothetical protein
VENGWNLKPRAAFGSVSAGFRLSGNPRKASLRSRALAKDSGLPHIAEVGPARPSPSVRVTKFDSDEVAFIRQRHINARLDIAKFRYGALGQSEMRSRTTSAAEVDFCGRIVFVFPAIVSGRALDADVGGVEIGPASARLAA